MWVRYVLKEFCNFSLVTKNVKSRSKIALLSNERHFEIWFLKKKTITVFGSKLSKLHKKDPILHVTATFSLIQGETRTNSVPIPHPLKNKNPCLGCQIPLLYLLRDANFSPRNRCLGCFLRVHGWAWSPLLSFECPPPVSPGYYYFIHRIPRILLFYSLISLLGMLSRN